MLLRMYKEKSFLFSLYPVHIGNRGRAIWNRTMQKRGLVREEDCMRVLEKLSDFVSKWMALIVILVAAISLFFPSSVSFIKTAWINTLLGIVMFGMGLTLKPSDFTDVFKRPRDVIIGAVAQFTLMPLLAFLLTKVFRLSPELAIGVILGIVVNRFFSKVTEKAVKALPLISTTAIVLIIAAVVSVNSARIMQNGLLIVCVVICHNVLGYLTGYLAARALKLDTTKCRAISIEVGMQNSGLATSLAATHFAQYPLATVPGAVFSVWHNISGAILANIFNYSSKHGGKI